MSETKFFTIILKLYWVFINFKITALININELTKIVIQDDMMNKITS